jgi:hypothetical protein
MRCPECGLENMPRVERCLRCGRGLRADMSPWSEVIPPRREDRGRRGVQAGLAYSRQAIVRTRGAIRRGRSGLARHWNLLWYQVDTSQEEVVAPRSPTLAGLLSIIPGLGHVYARNWTRALQFFVLFAAGVVAFILTLRLPVSNILLYGLVGLQAAAMGLAIGEVRRQNGQPPNAQLLLGAILLTLGLVSGMYSVAWVVLSRVYRPMILNYTIASTRVLPAPDGSTRLIPQEFALLRGDRFLVDMRASTIRHLKPGDTIFFRTEGLAGAVEQENLVSVQRIVAGPNEIITSDNGHVRRDGRPVSATEMPYAPAASGGFEMPPRFFVGEDEYAVGPFWYVVGDHGQVQGPTLTSVPRRLIMGKAIAIYDPPARRRRL